MKKDMEMRIVSNGSDSTNKPHKSLDQAGNWLIYIDAINFHVEIMG